MALALPGMRKSLYSLSTPHKKRQYFVQEKVFSFFYRNDTLKAVALANFKELVVSLVF